MQRADLFTDQDNKDNALVWGRHWVSLSEAIVKYLDSLRLGVFLSLSYKSTPCTLFTCVPLGMWETMRVYASIKIMLFAVL